MKEDLEDQGDSVEKGYEEVQGDSERAMEAQEVQGMADLEGGSV